MAHSWNRLLSLADQGFSSASSILVVLVIARTSSVEEFGRFSVAYAALVLCLGISRSLYGTRISMTGSPGSARVLTGVLAGGILVAAPVIALPVLLLSVLLTGGGGAVVWAVAIAAPLVCFQDIIRFGAIASNRPGAALLSDAVWFAMMVLAFFLPRDREQLILVLWVGAVAVSAVVGLVALRVLPQLRDGLPELKQWDAVAGSSALGTLVTLGASLVVVSLAASTLGAAAAGALRGASTLMGPLNVVFAYVNIALTPALIRSSRDRDLRYGGVVAGVLAAVATVWGLFLLVLPDGWGQLALGPSWEATNPILGLTAVQYIALAVAAASTLVLKVRLKAKVLAWQKFVVAVCTVAGAVLGIVVGMSVLWVAAGLAAASLAGAVLGWVNVWQARRGLRSA